MLPDEGSSSQLIAGARGHSPGAPTRTVPWAQHPEGQQHPGTHRQLSQQAMSSVRM